MSIDDREGRTDSPRTTVRGVTLAAAIGVFAIAVLAIIWVWRSDPPAAESLQAPAASRAVTTTSLVEQDEVQARLRDILRVRDQAYKSRDLGLLREVYTSDCPCLRGDGAAIKQLLKDDAVWVGASTSVRITKVEKVSDKVWVVIANFDASAFRIETESGTLVRAVEGRSELFRFVLARASDREELLLGFAGPVDQGR
jgi:hypothetical protein